MLTIKEKPALIYSVDIPNSVYVVMKRNPQTQFGGTVIMINNELEGYVQKIDSDYQLYVKYTGNINMIEKSNLNYHNDDIIGFVTGPKFYSGSKTSLLTIFKKD